MRIFRKIFNFSKKLIVTSNSEVLVEDIRATLAEVMEQNQNIVGQSYTTSGFNNHELVSDAVYFVYDCLEGIKFEYSDTELVAAVLAEIRSKRHVFESKIYDPDGIISGTLVDIENALKQKFSPKALD